MTGRQNDRIITFPVQVCYNTNKEGWLMAEEEVKPNGEVKDSLY